MAGDESLPLIAYYGEHGPIAKPAPASRWREWMNATVERVANRCLPLLVANEHGWVLGNPTAFTTHWDGRDHPEGVAIEYHETHPGEPRIVSSHFGYGIITWQVPYLFRTPPGYNLLARGPANAPKDGIGALEGIVETDWSVATFTMNWKLTRPDHPVSFEAGEPFCMVVPQERGSLERFQPELRPLKTDESLYEATRGWERARDQMQVRRFLAEHSKAFSDDWGAWEKDYFRGQRPDGTVADEHQTKLRLEDFAET